MNTFETSISQQDLTCDFAFAFRLVTMWTSLSYLRFKGASLIPQDAVYGWFCRNVLVFVVKRFLTKRRKCGKAEEEASI